MRAAYTVPNYHIDNFHHVSSRDGQPCKFVHGSEYKTLVAIAMITAVNFFHYFAETWKPYEMKKGILILYVHTCIGFGRDMNST